MIAGLIGREMIVAGKEGEMIAGLIGEGTIVAEKGDMSAGLNQSAILAFPDAHHRAHHHAHRHRAKL